MTELNFTFLTFLHFIIDKKYNFVAFTYLFTNRLSKCQKVPDSPQNKHLTS